METVSTWVLDKNKENYLRIKGKAEKAYDVSRHIRLHMSKYKEIKIDYPLCQTYTQTIVQKSISKNGPTYRRQVVNLELISCYQSLQKQPNCWSCLYLVDRKPECMWKIALASISINVLWICTHMNTFTNLCITHWGWEEMNDISQTFSTVFSAMKMFEFHLKSLKFVPKVLINHIPALVRIIPWRRPGDKPLSDDD